MLANLSVFLHRKVQRGSMKGQAKGNTRLHFGSWGIQRRRLTDY